MHACSDTMRARCCVEVWSQYEPCPCPVLVTGMRIKDNGPKMGLNGVDNGQLWFDNFRVPRASLLDK